jgi:hypothetical protein
LLTPKLATTISNRVSLLKCPTATEYGRDPVPVEYVIWLGNVPLPYPISIPILSVPELATTISR